MIDLQGQNILEFMELYNDVNVSYYSPCKIIDSSTYSWVHK